MTAGELLREVARRFARARLAYGHGTRNAREEAAWLLSSRLSGGSVLSKEVLERKIPERKAKQILAIARRRIRERIPLAYLLKEAWLGEHVFHVDRRAIVPRSYLAELLREQLRPWLRRAPRRVLDLCTGSGCLAILCALAFARCRVDAADLSRAALQVAGINRRKFRLAARVRLVRSDLFAALGGRKYDLIVCNPPYVTGRAMRRLPAEYRREPAMALSGGEDGLRILGRIIEESAGHLTPSGILACEIGGNRRALERARPDLPFAWPETSDGPGSIFILSRDDLLAARRPGARGTPPRPRRARPPARARAQRAAPASPTRLRRP